jgi:hypothetical protein
VIWKRILLLPLAMLAACQHGAAAPSSTAPPRVNQVVAYLDGADFQVETEGQVQEVLKALEDMRTLPPSALRARRYAGSGMEPGIWTLKKVLLSYFLPRDITTQLDEATLYEDAQDTRARAVVTARIQAIRADSSPRPTYPEN